MNTQQYHVAQENLVNEINKISKLVERNHFSEKIKKTFVEAVPKIIDAINENRSEVYKQLEDHEHTFDKYDASLNYYDRVNTEQDQSNVFHITNKINNELATMDFSVKEIHGNPPAGKFKKTDKFNDNQEIIDDSIKALVEVINEPVDEENNEDNKPGFVKRFFGSES